MKTSFISSPYKSDTRDGLEKNLNIARAMMLWAIHSGFAPYASHLLYTQCLPEDQEGRSLGIGASIHFLKACDVYITIDLHKSSGMLADFEAATHYGKEIIVLTEHDIAPHVKAIHKQCWVGF